MSAIIVKVVITFGFSAACAAPTKVEMTKKSTDRQRFRKNMVHPVIADANDLHFEYMPLSGAVNAIANHSQKWEAEPAKDPNHFLQVAMKNKSLAVVLSIQKRRSTNVGSTK
ncbi:hypothetical protein LJR030_003914 [Rhizobium sp. LjRoot30]|uniref:hypothetical protein n=1 Tax=Rhizobium sp. LjRoot30 TaxID=3342320 RepID=UPI003ED041EB